MINVSIEPQVSGCTVLFIYLNHSIYFLNSALDEQRFTNQRSRCYYGNGNHNKTGSNQLLTPMMHCK